MTKAFHISIVCLSFALLISASLFAQSQETRADGSILLPAQEAKAKSFNQEQQAQLSKSAAWQGFSQKHGNWSVQWNEATRTPHRAFGPSIQISGYSAITESNVQDAAGRFLSENSALLGVDVEKLKLTSAVEANNRWYVSYRQLENGIEVLLSEVELRIFRNGKVMTFGSDFYRNIDVMTTPSISFENAQQQARTGLSFNRTTDSVEGEGRLYILPIEQDDQISYHLVYKVYVKTEEPLGNFVTYVDAHTGDVRWRYNRVREYSDVSGTAKGMIQEISYADPFVEKAFVNQVVKIGETETMTDSGGNFTFTVSDSDSVTVTAELSGPWADVVRGDGVNRATFSKLVGPDETVNILWDSTNSHAAERDAFYHVNMIHDNYKALDENFVGMDYSVPTTVNINQGACNAFYDGNGLNFFVEGAVGPGRECPNLAQEPGVVYHEYGHGINDKFYQQLGTEGMVNGTTHEGMSDVASAFILDDHVVGRDVFGEGTQIRDLKNTLRYPEDVTDQIHTDGQIISGAFWDLREITSLETAERLSHYAKYGTPDDEGLGVAFSEWYLEVLVADDDDGDISNGTPNSEAIDEAFDAHGIGAALFVAASLQHTQLPDQSADATSYSVELTLGNSIDNRPPEATTIHYSTDNFATTATVAASAIGNQQYRGEIPQVAKGSFVNYYFSAIDPFSGETIVSPAGAPDRESYRFIVGFESKLLDAFETETGWAVGAPGDSATLGIWERSAPDLVEIPGFAVLQPAEDHSESGELCFLTKATNGPGGLPVSLDGRTTLISPVFDLSNVETPLISYYTWLSVEFGVFAIDISNDGGQTWHSIKSDTLSVPPATSWERTLLKVDDYIEPNATVQLRFTVQSFTFESTRGVQTTIVIALLDDFEILGTGGTITSVDEQHLTAGLPEKFALLANYPNPFNPETTIRYDLPQDSRVVLRIYNLLGQEVRTLLNENQAAGARSLSWDGRNNAGRQVPSGVYIYRITAGNFGAARKMVLQK